MNGYETRSLVQAQITALQRELRGHHWSERHLEEIRAQIKVFERELARMVRTGEGLEPEDKRRGQSTLIRNSSTGQDYQTWMN